MSTKTTIKRIALVAAVAAAFGGLSTVAANATFTLTGVPSWAASNVYSGSGKATASQTIGQTATLAFTETATTTTTTDIIANFSSTGVGTVTTTPVVTGGAGTLTVGTPGSTAVPNGTTIPVPTVASGYDVFQSSGSTTAAAVTTTFTVYSAVAGTQTLTANINGVNYTATLNWIATSGAGVSATQSYVYTASASGCATALSTPGLAQADKVANGTTSAYYAAGTAQLCVAAFDANGNPITPSAVKVYGIGSPNGAAASVSGNTWAALLTGDSTNKGTSAYTVYITDSLGNTVSVTSNNFTWYGKVAKVVLANDVYADHASASSASKQTYVTGSTDGLTGVHSFGVELLDSAGNVIPRKSWGSVTNDVSASNLLIVSDKGNGNTATAKGQSNAWATVSYDSTGYDSAGQGKSWGGMDVACSQAGKYEHLTITAYAFDPATGVDDIASNPIDFYCSALPATVTVTPSATSAAAGSIVTVDASATDANGYPVYDGYSLALGASNGGVFLGSSTGATTNGSITGGAAVGNNPLQLIVGSQGDNVVTVAATNAAGASISASATVATSGGVASSANAATDAANEATDAANAATDAANAAADAADAATAAAQDAGAKADAALAAVTALSAKITVLAAQIAKIVKKLGA